MRRRLIVTACLALGLLIAGATVYKKWMPLLDKRSNNGDPTDSQQRRSSVPPFPTKEPERYQATRIVTFSETQSSLAHVSPVERTSRVLIARDGEKRREEFFDGANETLVYLEIPAGRFVLLPASAVYADLSAAASETDWQSLADDPYDSRLSPDLLSNEGYSGSTYENFGAERLEGRMAIKYRVTPVTRKETAAKVETFIWIDETLGLPVRSETVSRDGEHLSKATTELKDIKLEMDEGLIALPANYRKVEAKFILDRTWRSGKLAAPSQDHK